MASEEHENDAIESPSQVITSVGDTVVVDDRVTYGTESFNPLTEHKENTEK